MAEVILKKHEGRLLKSGGAWIFDNEIDRVEGPFINGDLVAVHDHDGYQMGTGFINMHSKIRVRMLTRDPEQKIDDEFLRRRLTDAWEMRKRCVDTSSCRVIFGEADFLPGLTVDKYEDILVVESLALGMDRMKERILDLLKAVLEKDGIRIRGIYERSDAKERLKEGMERVKGWIGPELPDREIVITENGVKYFVDFRDGQKTGFFLDQKYNRRAIHPFASGAEVLDCFTHTGSFALNAALSGASRVTGVDASQAAVDMAHRNTDLNGFTNVEFQKADVLELLPALVSEGKKYDLVILDPPAFAKSREHVRNAVRGYREINRNGMQLVRRGGYFASCTCSHFMTRELFEKMLSDAARDAHVRLRQIEARAQAPDHPILWTAGESSYLKFYIFQIV